MTVMRFFVLGGAILILTGGLQLVVRPPKPNESRYLNRGTLWTGFCVIVGLLAILVGSGTLPVRFR